MAAAIAERDELAATVHRAESALARLRGAAHAAAPVEAELAALDAEETAAALSWSRDPDAGAPPALAVARRASIAGSLAEARSAEAAARRAVQPLTAEHDAAAGRLHAAERNVKAAAGLVLVGEIAALGEEHRAAINALARIQSRIESGRVQVITTAHALNRDGDGAELTRPIMAALEGLDGALGKASPHAFELADLRAAESVKWGGLLARLEHDAEAQAEA